MIEGREIDHLVNLKAEEGYWLGSFEAMASPCEIFMEVEDQNLAARLLDIASVEAWRIESKFSRYRSDNIVHQINNSKGRPVKVDDEVAHLLDFAQQCWMLSEGMFDITSGVLRRVWHFDGGSRLPEKQDVDQVLSHVGWHKLTWSRPYLTLPDGMEIDFGGLGKEYAVDRSLLLLQKETHGAVLINYGGDINAKGQRKGGKPWSIGIENPGQLNTPMGVLKVNQGALATSGDARRFILNNGRRYGHILNPKTGWPVEGALRSVTVAGSTCTEAGLLATLALLQGEEGEAFLKNQDVTFWVTP
ncbi:MAG: FAD:protein FMN transferase [Candidatus Thiodiazotropha sp. 6PLUC1]